MTDMSPRDCVLHLRGLDSDVQVNFVGSGAADLHALATEAWSRCLSTPSAGAARRLVRVDGKDPSAEQCAPSSAEEALHPDLVGSDLAQLMDRLSPVVTLAAIEQQAGRLMMLHAAAVADPNTGRALAMVGPSGAGKTTATRVLAKQWGYLTDETVGIRLDGTIAIYPKPLSVKVASSPYKEQCSLDALGLGKTPRVALLHRVVLLERDGSPEPWLEPVPTATALALLAPETSYLSRLSRPLHRLAGMLGRAGLRRLHYDEAEQLPAIVGQILRED